MGWQHPCKAPGAFGLEGDGMKIRQWLCIVALGYSVAASAESCEATAARVAADLRKVAVVQDDAAAYLRRTSSPTTETGAVLHTLAQGMETTARILRRIDTELINAAEPQNEDDAP